MTVWQGQASRFQIQHLVGHRAGAPSIYNESGSRQELVISGSLNEVWSNNPLTAVVSVASPAAIICAAAYTGAFVSSVTATGNVLAGLALSFAAASTVTATAIELASIGATFVFAAASAVTATANVINSSQPVSIPAVAGLAPLALLVAEPVSAVAGTAGLVIVPAELVVVAPSIPAAASVAPGLGAIADSALVALAASASTTAPGLLFADAGETIAGGLTAGPGLGALAEATAAPSGSFGGAQTATYLASLTGAQPAAAATVAATGSLLLAAVPGIAAQAGVSPDADSLLEAPSALVLSAALAAEGDVIADSTAIALPGVAVVQPGATANYDAGTVIAAAGVISAAITLTESFAQMVPGEAFAASPGFVAAAAVAPPIAATTALQATAVVALAGVAPVQGEAALAASLTVNSVSTYTVTTAATVAAAAVRLLAVPATAIGGVSAVAATGTIGSAGQAAIAAQSTVSAIGAATHRFTQAIATTAALVGSPQRLVNFPVAVQSAAALATDAYVLRPTAAEIDTVSTVATFLQVTGQAFINTAGGFSAAAITLSPGGLPIAALGGFAVIGASLLSASPPTIAATASVASNAQVLVVAAPVPVTAFGGMPIARSDVPLQLVPFSGAALVAAGAGGLLTAQMTTAGQFGVITRPTGLYAPAFEFDASSSVSAFLARIVPALAAIGGAGSVVASADRYVVAASEIDAAGSLATDAYHAYADQPASAPEAFALADATPLWATSIAATPAATVATFGSIIMAASAETDGAAQTTVLPSSQPPFFAVPAGEAFVAANAMVPVRPAREAIMPATRRSVVMPASGNGVILPSGRLAA